MRKKVTSSPRTTSHELAAIATTLRQIHLTLKRMADNDDEIIREQQFEPAAVRPDPVRQRYLAGRWKYQDGTLYHPLDEKPGALEEEQRAYQRTLIDGKKTDNS